MSAKQPAVYIMASRGRGTLYVGVTGWLKHRTYEHREGLVEGFIRQYGLGLLVWYEFHADFPAAIAREKQLKKWNRAWKLELIEKANPLGWILGLMFSTEAKSTSFPRTRESSRVRRHSEQSWCISKWIPAFAGMTKKNIGGARSFRNAEQCNHPRRQQLYT